MASLMDIRMRALALMHGVAPLEQEFVLGAEAAILLGLRPETIRTYCRRGLLPGVKVGHRWYISRESIAAYRSKPMSPFDRYHGTDGRFRARNSTGQ